jgi:hypothetical protein
MAQLMGGNIAICYYWVFSAECKMHSFRLSGKEWIKQVPLLVLFLSWAFIPAADAGPRQLGLPAAPRMHLPTEEPAPPAYPLSYADEVARSLGIAHGKMDVFSVSPTQDDDLVPSLKGGVDRNGAGVKLQWQFGK